MIKSNQDQLNKLNISLDLLLVVLSYIFSSWFRLRVLTYDIINPALTGKMILAAIFYAAGLILVLAILGFYNTTRTRSMLWKLKQLLVGLTVSVLIASSLLYVFRLEDFSRGIIIIFYFLTLFLLGGKYIATRLILNQLRTQGYNIKHELLIGTGSLAKQYEYDVAYEPELGISIEVVLSPSDLNGIVEALKRPDIDEVVLALDAEDYSSITRLIGECEKQGMKYLIIPFYNNIIPAHPVFEQVGNSKLINMRFNQQEDVFWAAIKRGFDVILSTILLLVLSPLMLLIALGVRLSSPGPILFKQERVGYNRKTFYMLKFRSMFVNNRSDTTWSTLIDDRRTTFGTFIRRYSLDELPQLWNVLKGEMSLVGPRPELPYFVDKFKKTVPLYMVKHQVKPGITGWAQVNGYRGDTSIPKRIELDLWYIENWSPILDLKILFMTPKAMPNVEQIRSEGNLHNNVKIIVATHKPYWMPKNELYIPLHVGADFVPETESEKAGFSKYIPDNTGDNISEKNRNYCELTGLYWAWKNLDCDYLGIAHYRRHFTIRGGSTDRRDILDLEQAQRLIVGADVLLPKKRNYWIETNYSQYVHAHHAEDLDLTRIIISERCPEYLKAFDSSMKKTTGHRFNMFIMKRDIADRYCSWLFDILFELEKRLDISSYNDNDKRVFGFVSERLLDVWLETNKIKYKDIPYIFLEKENWITKGAAFIKRKLEARAS